jgi:hypothetical protein
LGRILQLLSPFPATRGVVTLSYRYLPCLGTLIRLAILGEYLITQTQATPAWVVDYGMLGDINSHPEPGIWSTHDRMLAAAWQ